MSDLKAAVVVAAYNELTNLEALVPRLLALDAVAHIVIVDDNSPDGSPAWLRTEAAKEPRLKPLIRAGKLGYGSAMRQGFRAALDLGTPAVVTLDADFSHDPDAIPDLVAALDEGADVAVGSRYVGGVRVLNWHVSRLLLSLGANKYVRTILGLPVVDATSGFRAYRRASLESGLGHPIGTQGYAFLVELLYRIHRAGHIIREVPIVYAERREGQSKMSGRVIWEAVLRPWKLRLFG